jgi:excisionase family DNA binding protein
LEVLDVASEKAFEKLYTVKEAAQVTTLSPWTIWAYLTQGRIKRTKISRRTVIRESELQKLLKD